MIQGIISILVLTWFNWCISYTTTWQSYTTILTLSPTLPLYGKSKFLGLPETPSLFNYARVLWKLISRTSAFMQGFFQVCEGTKFIV